MNSARQTLLKEVGRLRKFAYSLTGNPADADDLVQEVVIKVLEKGLPEHRDPVPWLITLCKNQWVDTLRHREVMMRPENTEHYRMTMTSEPADNLQQLQTSRIMDAMQRLPEPYRLALSLVAVEGMSYVETARILDVPAGTIMSRVARARALMQDFFKEPDETLS